MGAADREPSLRFGIEAKAELASAITNRPVPVLAAAFEILTAPPRMRKWLAPSFPAGKCGYGRHEASSDGPFSLTVWGIGKDASYGYAGGAGSGPVNDVSPIPVR